MNTTRIGLTLDELLEQTNTELALWLPEGATVVPFNERTLRYYVSQGLLPRLGTRGPKARYPESFVWRLLFVRRLQHERSLTLEQVRGVLEQVPAEAIERVGRDGEPLEFALEYTDAAVRAHSDAVPSAAPRNAPAGAPADAGDDADGPSAAAYLQRHRHRFGGGVGAPAPGTDSDGLWQGVWRDARAEIRVRGDLSDAQRRQIESLGALLHSILED